MTNLPIVSLNVESAYSRMMSLNYLHTRHESCDADIVRHGLRHEVLSRNVHVSSSQGEIAQETTPVFQEEGSEK